MEDKKKYPQVSIVILNWNGWKDTIECLESVYQNTYPNYNVILVDNNSNDESLNKIRLYCEGKILLYSEFFVYNTNNKPIKLIEKDNGIFPVKGNSNGEDSLILLKNSKNLGFAVANNVAIEWTVKNSNPDFILLLNNDTVVSKGFLIELVKVCESNNNVGVAGPKCYFYNNPGQIQFTGGALNFDIRKMEGKSVWGEFDSDHYEQDFEVANISGACMLIKKSVIDSIGVFDPDYYLYCEDLDLSFRIMKRGFKLMYVHRSIIWHKGSASSSSELPVYYMSRNQFLFIKKNGNLGEKLYFYVYFFLFKFWRPFPNFFIFRKYGMLQMYLRGIIHGIQGKKGKLDN